MWEQSCQSGVEIQINRTAFFFFFFPLQVSERAVSCRCLPSAELGMLTVMKRVFLMPTFITALQFCMFFFFLAQCSSERLPQQQGGRPELRLQLGRWWRDSQRPRCHPSESAALYASVPTTPTQPPRVCTNKLLHRPHNCKWSFWLVLKTLLRGSVSALCLLPLGMHW